MSTTKCRTKRIASERQRVRTTTVYPNIIWITVDRCSWRKGRCTDINIHRTEDWLKCLYIWIMEESTFAVWPSDHIKADTIAGFGNISIRTFKCTSCSERR